MPLRPITQLNEIKKEWLSCKLAVGTMTARRGTSFVRSWFWLSGFLWSRVVQRQLYHQLSERPAIECGQTQQLTDGKAGAPPLLPADELLPDAQLLSHSLFGDTGFQA